MKEIIGRLGLYLIAVVAFVVGAVPAHASNFSNISIDTAPVYAVAFTVVSALAAIWGIRKIIKLLNRS